MKPKITLLLLAFFMSVSNIHSQNPLQIFSEGAYIVDMGQNSTLNKGLKPYGFVYALIRNNNVPVYWSINSAKIKDGKDFTVNGKDYKGGTFIIASEDINPTITTLIATWRTNGAVIDGPIASSFTAPIYNKLTSWPRAILDTQNDGLITPYYANAGVPSASYVTEGNPTQLTSCGDVYILPHADPQNWPTTYVTALKNYMNQGGSLWVGCHAVSALDLVSPPFNFLTNNGLVPWTSHDKPDNTDVYTYDPGADADPIMQFMGKMDASLHNGSEEIYLPKVGSSWLPSTKIAIYNDPYTDGKTHITYDSTNRAALLAYGHTNGDPTKGMVMYEAAHSYDGAGATASEIAAERAYFNFVLLSGIQKQISITLSGTFPTALTPNTLYPLSATVTGNIGAVTYEWSALGGGTFSPATGTTPGPTITTNYTAPAVIGNIALRLKVTDACGRINFVSVFMNGGSTVSCDSQATPPATPTFANNCGGAIIFTGPVQTNGPGTPCNTTKTFTWTYTDFSTCSPSAGPYNRSWSYIYTIHDTTAPIWTTTPDALNTNVQCGDIAALAVAQALFPVATDCNTMLPLNKISGGFVGAACGGTYTNTWTVTDACNNTSTVFTQVISIIDAIAPIIGEAGADATINCPDTPVFTTPTATDECGTATVHELSDTTTAGNPTCPGNYSRTKTWDATDACGNHSLVRSQTITVHDITPPAFESLPGPTTIANNATPLFQEAVATDTCSSVTLTYIDVATTPNCDGSYSITRNWTAKDLCDNAGTASQVINISAAVVVANSDIGASVNGYTGGTSFTNVLANDTLNGVAVMPTQITTTFVSSTNVGVTLSGTNVVVAAGTPAGSYTLIYQICGISATCSCDQASVTVPISAAVIDAVNDAGASVNGYTGGTSFTNVLANDTLNGAAVIPAQVTTTFVSATNAGVTLSGTNVVVAAGTPAGSYTLTYQICEKLNLTNCDTAVVTVPVSAAVIDAVNDAGNPVLTGVGGQSFANVLINDTLNGDPATLSNVILSQLSTTNPGVTLNPLDGSVNVTSDTLGGNYFVTYGICEILNPLNCDTAIVSVFVEAPSIVLLKTGVFADTNADGYAQVGEKINYTFAVTNTGNVTITNTVISDPLVGLVLSGNPIASLAPGVTGNVTGVYTITQADIDAGKVTNSALATGKDPNGNDVTDTSGTTVENDTPTIIILPQESKITVTKTANIEEYSFVGDIITYTIKVQNTGHTTLHDVVVTDLLTGLNTAVQGPAIPILLAGESIEFSQSNSGHVSYTITKNDLVEGKVTNTVEAKGFAPNENEVKDVYTLVIEKGTVLGCGTIIVHNAFSPNNDGINEVFFIESINDPCYPDNTVEIYNRWGVLVFETQNYNNESNFFDGISRGRTTIKQSSGLPTGTYYYILNYTSVDLNGNINSNKKAGYLFLSR